MSDSPVSYGKNGSIGVISINNPPVNALSQKVRQGISDALEESLSDNSKMLLIMCQGRTFIAGADITELGKPPVPPHLPDIITRMENHPKPIVMALHGNALGGGLEVAMAGHYRCAIPGTKLGLPEVKLGLLPGAGGTQRLPRLVGPENALDMIVSGNPINAEKALKMGLIDHLLDEGIEKSAIAYANQLIQSNSDVRPTGKISVTTPSNSNLFSEYRDRIARKTRGQIAPDFIIKLVELACSSDIIAGQEKEREYFLECRSSPQSAALRHVFFAERATSKLPDIPSDTQPRDISSAGVIGAGTMGGGIAMCFANAGIPVKLIDTDSDAVARGMQIIEKNYANSMKRGRFTQEKVDAAMSCITASTEFESLKEADIVIEAVFENMAVKEKVFSQMDEVCKKGAILASNTSYLDIDQLADSTNRAKDVIGSHFFSPANVMKLLEIVRTTRTAPDVVQTLIKLSRKIGKVPVAVGLCHGFVGNRMLKGYGRQAQLLLLEGASPQQIDSVMEGWGLAMGPLAVSDLAGLDIGYRSRRDQGLVSGELPEFALPDALVELDRLGQKSSAGYYQYDKETRARQIDPEVEALLKDIAARFEITQQTISEEVILDRLLLALVNEGTRILEEGIATRPSDIDIVYLNGYGFPAWRGGPMFHADTVGLDTVVEKITALYNSTQDDFWKPSKLLENLVEKGDTLSSLNNK